MAGINKRIIFAPLIILIFVYLFVATFRAVRQQTIDEFNIQQTIIAQQAATEFKDFFERTDKELNFLANIPGIINPNSEGFELMDIFIAAQEGAITAIARIDADGHNRYTSAAGNITNGNDRTFQKYFQLSATKSGAIVSEYFKTTDGYGAVAYYVPVFDDHIFQGSLAVLINFDAITREYLESIQIGVRASSWLLSARGIELYCTTPNHVGKTVQETSGQLPSTILLSEKMLSSRKGIVVFQVRSENRHCVFQRIDLPNTFWSIAIATPEGEILAAMKGFRNKFFQIALLSILTLFGSYYSVLRAWNVLTEARRRKQAENALKESEALKSAVLDNSPIGISVRNSQGTLLLANKAWQKIWNISDEDLWKRLTPRVKLSFDDRDNYLGEYLSSVKKVYELGGRFYVPEVQPLYQEEGKAEWIAQFFYAIEDDKGNVDKVVVLTEDISHRKQVEQELLMAKQHAEENEARFKALHNASFGGITIHDKGLILDCNQGLADITGYSIEELVGMDGLQLIASQSRDLVMSKILTEDEKPYRATGVRKNGEEYPLRLEARMIPYQGKTSRVVEFRDITEQKEAEAAREVLESQLRQSQKLEALGTMVGGISHELNNVLQSMFLYGGMIQSELSDNENIKKNFKHLTDGAEKARDIVKQILTFSRKTKIDLKPQTIHETVIGALALERVSVSANIEIKQDIHTNCGLVMCDKTQINQIVINLCNNAQHAMREEGGTITVRLLQNKASLSKDDPEVEVLELKVSDNGHGIDPADIEQIFDPFYTTKEPGEGTGLGLSVIHGIVELMGGRISVTSELNKGTSFTILLPVVDGETEIHNPPKSTPPSANISKSILLVDDEDSIRKASHTLLTRKGFTVTSASDGQQGLDLFKINPEKFNIIITDLSMPILSGIELTKEIRELNSEIPILLSTGRLGIEDKQEYKDIGITGFIKKPWTVQELIECIGKLPV